MLLQGAVGQVDSFLYSQGLNSQALVSNARDAQTKAESALNTASPSVNKALTTVSSSSPTVLAEYALGLVALYYLVRTQLLLPYSLSSFLWHTLPAYTAHGSSGSCCTSLTANLLHWAGHLGA